MTSDLLEANPSTADSRVRAAHRAASRVVLAFAACIVLETAIGLYVVNSRPVRVTPTQSPYPFYVGAVFLALGSIAYRRAQMRRLRLEVIAGLRGVGGLIKHLFQVTIVSAAMAEAIGVLAILVGLFSGEQTDVIRFGVVALVVELFTYPRRQAWQRVVDFFAAATPGIKEGR
ncbi:MAG TPA: hypothetical protein VJZ26_03340 [Blastocatellia bacterium]|nr:hypothetical protein [Blastocatellia bacterium]